MALKTKKPNIEDFISGAKADATPAPAATPEKAKAAKPASEKPKREGRGKTPSKYMAKVGDTTMSRYQLRILRRLHRKLKAASSLIGMDLSDFMLEASIEKMARIEAASLGITAEKLAAYIERRKKEEEADTPDAL